MFHLNFVLFKLFLYICIMNAKEFCQRYNLGVDSVWISRKYANKVHSLNEWFNLVKDDLTNVPDALNLAVSSQKNNNIASEDDSVLPKAEKVSSKKSTEGK